MSGILQGKTALVTGAARGQGRSHALRMAAEGANIIAIDVYAQLETVTYSMPTPEDLEATLSEIRAHGVEAIGAVVDVRDRGPLHRAVADAVAQLGGLDIVVANAGISPIGPDVPVSAWFETAGVNMVGVFNTVDAAFPHLGEGASIVCIGSMSAMLNGTVDNPASGPGGAGYAHAKREVTRLVHDLALPLAPLSIRVNAIHPGNVDTDMLQNKALYRLFRPDLEDPGYEDAQPAFGSMHQLPVNTIPPADISEAVLFLASDASRYITGQQLKVDAGALLRSTTSGAPA